MKESTLNKITFPAMIFGVILMVMGILVGSINLNKTILIVPTLIGLAIFCVAICFAPNEGNVY